MAEVYQEDDHDIEERKKLAQLMFDYNHSEGCFSQAMVSAGFGDYTGIGGDYYDCSIEFHEVGDDARLNEAQQKIVWEAGFCKAYVNHKDGWETHYSWPPKEFKPYVGWRRFRKPEGGFLISGWPAGWGDPQTGRLKDWLTSGYMTIVPDAPTPGKSLDTPGG